MPSKPSLESRQKIYRSLCHVLSERIDQVGWDEFTPADWELFGQMAEREGVAPLMYWKLKDSPVEVQPSTFNFLRSTYYQTLAQNTLMYQELERILTALDEVGIEVIVLKGAALAATVYEDIGLRPMGDLDLLVHEYDFQDTLSIMVSLDYKIEPLPSYNLNKLIGRNLHLHSENHSNLKVEIHWRLGSGNDSVLIPDEDLTWKRAGLSAKFGKVFTKGEFTSVLILRPGPQLIYLSTHLLILHSSRQRILLWFYDIYKLLQHDYHHLDWADIDQLIQNFGRDAILRIALEESLKRFDLPLISVVVKRLKSNGMIADSTLSKNILYKEAASRLSQIIKLFYELGYRARFYFIVSKIFPNPEYMRWRYSQKKRICLPFLYLYRLIELVKLLLLETLKSRKIVVDKIQKNRRKLHGDGRV